MNTNNEETFYQVMRRKGVGKRSFLKYRSLAATPLGLGAGMTPRITQALKSKPRIPVAWIHGPGCTYCIESFIHSSHPLAKDAILSLIFLDYDDTPMATAGTQVEGAFEDILNRYHGRYILTVEDDPPLGEQGMLYISSRCPFTEKLKRAAASANAIIVWGVHASQGRMQAARPNPTQATPTDKVTTDKPIVKVPGCSPIPNVTSVIITYLVTFGRSPEPDCLSHPLMFYGQRIHDKCYRRAHFDAEGFVESWDDDAAHQGCCLYEMDCKGPIAYNACSTTRWSGGVSFPIQSSHGCLGYSENDFWDRGSFYSRAVDIPQMGTYSIANTVDLAALDVVAAGVGVHVVASAVDQRYHCKQRLANAGQQSPDNKDKQA